MRGSNVCICWVIVFTLHNPTNSALFYNQIYSAVSTFPGMYY